MRYSDAGVDITAGNRLVDRIKPIAQRTFRPEVVGNIGGFGALFSLPLDRYQQPVLVSSTDGVGTKLKLAITLQQHKSIGVDLVAMCVNDIITCGAEPLFFLDYYATGALDIEIATQIIESIGQGCEQAGVALIGGETAEMPGLYQAHDYDLAGFCVGIVEKSAVIDGHQVQAGDKLIAIASSGIHANGYALVRKILDTQQISLDMDFHGQTLGEVLLAPTRIYVKSLLQLFATVPVHALAHITGGGLLENIPRVIPSGLCATIDTHSWEFPLIFRWLQQQGNIPAQEMYRTFNCGVGMVTCVPATHAETALAYLTQWGETAWVLGDIVTRTDDRIVLL